MGYHDVWVIGETKKGDIRDVSFELLNRGRKLADKLGGNLVAILIILKNPPSLKVVMVKRFYH